MATNDKWIVGGSAAIRDGYTTETLSLMAMMNSDNDDGHEDDEDDDGDDDDNDDNDQSDLRSGSPSESQASPFSSRLRGLVELRCDPARRPPP